MTTRTLRSARISQGKKHLASVAVAAMLVTTWAQSSHAAGAFDTTDPEYAARAAEMVAQGKITEKCLPSSATAPDSAYTPIPAPSEELIAAAVQEGQLVLNSGLGDKASIDAYQAAFQARYPQIQMSVASGGSAAMEQRLLADDAAGNQQVDAAITNKIEWIEEAFKQGALLPLDQTIPGIFDTWPAGSWKWDTDFGSTAPGFNRALGIAYNTDLVTGDLIPKQFADLANPAFKGQLIGVDPAASVTFARVWKHIADTVGDDTMKAIGENLIKSPLYDDIQVAAQVLGAGGGMVIMEMGFNVADAMKEDGAPVQAVMPDTATGPQYVYAVAAKAPHPNAATLFGHWLYSAEGQWVLSCAAYAGTVAYPDLGPKTFVPIDAVSDEEIARIKELLGI